MNLNNEARRMNLRIASGPAGSATAGCPTTSPFPTMRARAPGTVTSACRRRPRRPADRDHEPGEDHALRADPAPGTTRGAGC